MTKFISIGLLLLLPFISSATQSLRACVDNRYWYPFSYLEANEAKGIFIEMAKTALENNDIKIEFIVMPIKRCINILGSSGKIDAALSVPYLSLLLTRTE